MPKKPKVLFLDVETSYAVARIWRTGKQYVTHEQIMPGWEFDIICVCWKWLGEKQIHSLDWGAKNQNSAPMIDEFTKIIESADVVIGHNIDGFDLKQINTQRLIHGQPPIAWPTSEDTLKQFRKHFYFPSNKLDYLSKTLIGAGKDPMAFRDWIEVVENKSPKALAKMIKYCKKDVLRLEQVYKKAAAFFDPKANRALLTTGDKYDCPSCGSSHVVKNATITRKGNRYQRRLCKSCGHTYKAELLVKLN